MPPRARAISSIHPPALWLRNPRHRHHPKALTQSRLQIWSMRILSSVKSRKIVPLGSAFPGPLLFPLDRLRRALSSSTRTLDIWSTFDDLPPGNERLRRQIGKRYLTQGLSVSADEIVLTNGALEALNLCLQAVARPGDAVVVECPSFYAALQSLERLQIKAIEVPTHPREGVDLSRLAHVLETQRPKACWLMTNFQNPLGCSLSREKKRALVDLLSHHEVPLIEDDVYGELHHTNEPPSSAKTFDQRGLVMHCSSFSKTLSPGYRVGWVAAGRFANSVRRLKLMTSLSGSIRHKPRWLSISSKVVMTGICVTAGGIEAAERGAGRLGDPAFSA